MVHQNILNAYNFIEETVVFVFPSWNILIVLNLTFKTTFCRVISSRDNIFTNLDPSSKFSANL